MLLDILVSTCIAQARGLLSAFEADRIFALVEALDAGLDYGVLDTDLMWASLLDRIKHRNGLQRVPLSTAIGDCIFTHDITRAELHRASTELLERLTPTHESSLER